MLKFKDGKRLNAVVSIGVRIFLNIFQVLVLHLCFNVEKEAKTPMDLIRPSSLCKKIKKKSTIILHLLTTP